VFWVGVILVVSEKEGTGKAGEKSLLLPLPRASRGRRKATVPFKNGTILGFSFFFNEQCMKRRCFGQNVPFHLKEKGGKTNVSEFTLVINL